jgi:uncharacterized protein (TIGR02757 family)
MNKELSHDLKKALELVLASHQKSSEIERDPISWVLGFERKEDREVTAFIAALFSYGRVAQIQNTLFKIDQILGSSPFESLKKNNSKYWQKHVPKDFRHRFNDQTDLVYLFSWLGEALRRYESLEKFFLASATKGTTAKCDESCENDNSISLELMLEDFISRLIALPILPLKYVEKRGIKFLLPLPSRKSACKRLMLFLRWVVGNGPMDLNLWHGFSRSKLLIPVDTHILRISNHLGLTKRRDQSWQTAVEITESLKQLDASDPTRFDFALCHIGISQECPSRFDIKICHNCRMNNLCQTYLKSSRKHQKRICAP